MRDEDYNPTDPQQAKPNLDRLLDAALANYAAVEPRDGLETRILANLRAQAKAPQRVWWRWGLAAAALAIVVVVIGLAWRSGKPAHPQIAYHPSVTTSKPSNSGTQLANRGADTAPKGHVPIHSVPVPANTLVPRFARDDKSVVAQNPKLDQFPSPQPLSEQEKILARYVEAYPKKAAVLARLRSEELRRERMEEKKAAPASAEADFDDE